MKLRCVYTGSYEACCASEFTPDEFALSVARKSVNCP